MPGPLITDTPNVGSQSNCYPHRDGVDISSCLGNILYLQSLIPTLLLLEFYVGDDGSGWSLPALRPTNARRVWLSNLWSVNSNILPGMYKYSVQPSLLSQELKLLLRT